MFVHMSEMVIVVVDFVLLQTLIRGCLHIFMLVYCIYKYNILCYIILDTDTYTYTFLQINLLYGNNYLLRNYKIRYICLAT